MKLITRHSYLERIISLRSVPDIKILTGIRRSGKSKLMNAFVDWLKENEPDSNIIFIDFNNPAYDELRTYKKLYDYVEAHHKGDSKNYLLIDEVQDCDGFERAINGLHAS